MKIKVKVLIACLLTVTVVVCFSCKKAIKNRQQLIAFLNDPDNGLQKSEQVGDMKIMLTYKPWQLMEANPHGITQGKDGTNMFEFKDKMFFVLSLSVKNKEVLKQLPFSQYSEMIQVLSFRMNEFIDMVPGDKKPVEPLECIFQQTYGMGMANNILIVFGKTNLFAAENLKIRIKEFGLNTGNLNFEFQNNEIKKLQNITLN